LQDAQRQPFDVVLAEALDRVSRDRADVATRFKQLRFAMPTGTHARMHGVGETAAKAAAVREEIMTVIAKSPQQQLPPARMVIERRSSARRNQAA
jgi:hypothetical protein